MLQMCKRQNKFLSKMMHYKEHAGLTCLAFCSFLVCLNVQCLIGNGISPHKTGPCSSLLPLLHVLSCSCVTWMCASRAMLLLLFCNWSLRSPTPTQSTADKCPMGPICGHVCASSHLEGVLSTHSKTQRRSLNRFVFTC